MTLLSTTTVGVNPIADANSNAVPDPNQNTNFVLLRFIAALSDKSTTAEAVHYQKREKGECAYYCAQCEAEVFNVLFAKEDPIHKK